MECWWILKWGWWKVEDTEVVLVGDSGVAMETEMILVGDKGVAWETQVVLEEMTVWLGEVTCLDQKHLFNCEGLA